MRTHLEIMVRQTQNENSVRKSAKQVETEAIAQVVVGDGATVSDFMAVQNQRSEKIEDQISHEKAVDENVRVLPMRAAIFCNRVSVWLA